MEKKSTKPNVSTVTKNVTAKAAEPVKAAEPLKTAVKEVEPVKAAEAKAVVEKKAEEVKAVVEEKTTESVAEVKKAAGKVKEKATKKTRAAKAAKAALKPEVFVQFQDKEGIVEDAIEKAKAQFVAEGHRESSIKSLRVYLKPEDGAAYYVINDKIAGRVDLF